VATIFGDLHAVGDFLDSGLSGLGLTNRIAFPFHCYQAPTCGTHLIQVLKRGRATEGVPKLFNSRHAGLTCTPVSSPKMQSGSLFGLPLCVRKWN